MWDYIIVGAGTAGCVIADRLTASGRHRVLLVEAGGSPTLPVRMPAGMVKLFKGPQDWAYESEPQSGCDGQVVFAPRGRMLGGSANLNAQIHQWCHPADYDGWAEAGATGWSWRDVAPVLRRMEDWGDCPPDDRRRGTGGPMRVERLARPHPLAEAFVEAAARVGLPSLTDYNGAPYDGAALAQLTHRGGVRFSVYDAFLKPAMRRANLRLIKEAQVSRVLFEGRRAAGVEILGAGDLTVHRGREVILCAGAFGTPQILMRSGVGPAAHLNALGLEVIADRRQVGENLQDHPMAVLNYRTRRTDTLKSAETLGHLLNWLAFRRGPLASNGVEAMAFTRILEGPGPDLELLMATVEWRDQALAPPQHHAYALGAAVLAPRSRGRLWLKSPLVGDAPGIDFRLLSDLGGEDAQILLAGVRLIRQIVASEPLATETLGELGPGPDVRGDDELLAFLKSRMQTVYHPCGTCRMGDDPDAPVTPDLMLRGVQGVRVADASVIPVIPRGHPNAVVAMIGQRASDMAHLKASVSA